MRFSAVMGAVDLAAQLPSAFRKLGIKFVSGEPADDPYIQRLFDQLRKPKGKLGDRWRGARRYEELQMLKNNLEDAAAGKVPRILVFAHGDAGVPEGIRAAYEEELE